MKKIMMLVFIIFFCSSVFAQEAEIKLEHVGYGETQEEVYFTIHNVGDTPITNVIIYVDGKYFETIQGRLSPGRGLEKILHLKPGEHTIEVRTPEGAYDYLNVSIVRTFKKLPVEAQKRKEETSLERFKLLVGFSILMIVITIVYFLLKKPRLE
jgi:uncharacterized membrane protein